MRRLRTLSLSGSNRAAVRPHAGKRPARTQDDRAGTVADRRAHGAGQGPGDRPVGKNLVGRHVEPVLAELVQGRVAMVLRGHRRDLAPGRAVAAHMRFRDGGVHVHEEGMPAGVALFALLGPYAPTHAGKERPCLGDGTDIRAAEESLEHFVLRREQ